MDLDLVIIFKVHEYHSHSITVHVAQMTGDSFKQSPGDENQVGCHDNVLLFLNLCP